MEKVGEQNLRLAFEKFLKKDETLINVTYGIWQPHFLVIMFLVLFPIIGVLILLGVMKHYFIGLTDKRLLVLQVNKPYKPIVFKTMDFPLSRLHEMKIKTFTRYFFHIFHFRRLPFTYIIVRDNKKSFHARCHPRFSENNREQALKIVEAISIKN